MSEKLGLRPDRGTMGPFNRSMDHGVITLEEMYDSSDTGLVAYAGPHINLFGSQAKCIVSLHTTRGSMVQGRLIVLFPKIACRSGVSTLAACLYQGIHGLAASDGHCSASHGATRYPYAPSTHGTRAWTTDAVHQGVNLPTAGIRS